MTNRTRQLAFYVVWLCLWGGGVSGWSVIVAPLKHFEIGFAVIYSFYGALATTEVLFQNLPRRAKVCETLDRLMLWFVLPMLATGALIWFTAGHTSGVVAELLGTVLVWGVFVASGRDGLWSGGTRFSGDVSNKKQGE